MKYSPTKRLSEQELIDCETRSYGCQGVALIIILKIFFYFNKLKKIFFLKGCQSLGLDYATKKGVAYQEYYPYTGRKGRCKSIISSKKLILP